MTSGGSGSEPDTPWSSPSGGQDPGSAGEPTQPPPSQPYPAPPGGSPYQQPYQQPQQQEPYPQYPQQPASPYQQYPPQPSPYGAQPYGAQPYGVQPYGAGGLFAKPNGKANTAMGLGIASVACAVLTLVCCITIPGVLCGPFAIGLAVIAKKEMDEQPGVYNNPGSAQVGLITGIIGTVLGVLMIVLVVAFFGFAISADDMS